MLSRLPRIRGPVAAALCSLLALGCADPDDRPLGPGGGGTDPRNVADAAPTGNWAYGRVCEVESFSDRGPCKPLRNANLTVSTFTSGTALGEDGSFKVLITHVAGEHVPVHVRSTDDWVGGTLAADAEEGEDLFDLEVPVMSRAIVDSVVEASGQNVLFGNGIVVVQTTSYSGLPLDGISFSDFDDIPARYGGPNSYQAGDTTSSEGVAVYFDTAVGSDNFELDFVDLGMPYVTHSIVAPDNFTIIPVQLSR